MIFVQLFSIFITIVVKQKNSSSSSSSTLTISVTFLIITMFFSRKGISPNPNVKQEFFPALCCHLGPLQGFILVSQNHDWCLSSQILLLCSYPYWLPATTVLLRCHQSTEVEIPLCHLHISSAHATFLQMSSLPFD